MKFKIAILIFLIFGVSASVGAQYLGEAQMDWPMAIAQGRVPGYNYIAKFGVNNDVDIATAPEDIWEGGGEYPDSAEGVFPAVGVADIVSISSSDADDEQDVLIYCLDEDGYQVTQIATLQGQTRVALTTPCWDIWRAENYDDTDFEGTIYIYSGTTATAGVPSGDSVTKALIDDGNNQTQMARFRVPRGEVAFLIRGEVAFGYAAGPAAGVEEVVFAFKVKTYGNVYKVKKTIHLLSTASNDHYDNRPIYDPIPALSVIKLSTIMVTEDNIDAGGTFHLVLVDQSQFSTAYLNSIAQPFQ